MVQATLGDFVDDEPALSKEQSILITRPTSFGGLGFQQLMAYLHFLPYAASVVLALAVYIVPRTGLAQTCKRTETLTKAP
jgi:hypothetical protein